MSPALTDTKIICFNLIAFPALSALSQQWGPGKAGGGLHALSSFLQPMVLLLALLFNVLEEDIAAWKVGVSKTLHMQKRKRCGTGQVLSAHCWSTSWHSLHRGARWHHQAQVLRPGGRGTRHSRKKRSNWDPHEQLYKISLTPYSGVDSADQWQACYLQYCEKLSDRQAALAKSQAWEQQGYSPSSLNEVQLFPAERQQHST